MADQRDPVNVESTPEAPEDNATHTPPHGDPVLDAAENDTPSEGEFVVVDDEETEEREPTPEEIEAEERRLSRLRIERRTMALMALRRRRSLMLLGGIVMLLSAAYAAFLSANRYVNDLTTRGTFLAIAAGALVVIGILLVLRAKHAGDALKALKREDVVPGEPDFSSIQ